jgi:serine/threonine protein kinase
VSSLKLLATAAEIAAGMLHLHSQGIIHGDLSAYNVLLSSADPSAAVGGRGFVAKVGDFGECSPHHVVYSKLWHSVVCPWCFVLRLHAVG